MNFTHLHVHTEYSLLDGASKIKELVVRTKELGMDSIAITDHGVMYGVIDFYRAAKEAGSNRLSAAKYMWHRVPVLTGRTDRERSGTIIWCCWQKTTGAIKT